MYVYFPLPKKFKIWRHFNIFSLPLVSFYSLLSLLLWLVTEQPCVEHRISGKQFRHFINKIVWFPHQVISSGIGNACTTLSKICHEIARHKTTLLRREVNTLLQRGRQAQDSWELGGGTRTSQVALYSCTQLEIS